MIARRHDEVYRAFLSIRNVCERYGMVWDWDENSGNMIVTTLEQWNDASAQDGKLQTFCDIATNGRAA